MNHRMPLFNHCRVGESERVVTFGGVPPLQAVANSTTVRTNSRIRARLTGQSILHTIRYSKFSHGCCWHPYQVIVQIGTKYRGSFNTLAFGEIKPYIGSLKDGRLDLVYYLDPGLNEGDSFPLWTLH
jgi:hypothetical protein